MTEFNVAVAVEQFAKRYVATAAETRVDNGRLYAGSPMTYYCKYCRVHTETLPELHMKKPRTVCKPCEPLEVHGLTSEAIEAGEALLERVGTPDAPPTAWERL